MNSFGGNHTYILYYKHKDWNGYPHVGRVKTTNNDQCVLLQTVAAGSPLLPLTCAHFLTRGTKEGLLCPKKQKISQRGLFGLLEKNKKTNPSLLNLNSQENQPNRARAGQPVHFSHSLTGRSLTCDGVMDVG